MTWRELWRDHTPAKRCAWIDQLRGLAVIVMIEVHVVNVWLQEALRPGWLNYLNGLVAPSFLMAAGFSLVLSTFRPDGTLRPFWPDTARRLGFILICAYALHAPGLTLADWTVLATPQKLREIFKIDVLQCIVFSLLVLHGLARVLRDVRGLAAAALGLTVVVPLIAHYLWAEGVADGLWLPIRGLFNGWPDRGVQALFPLFPWMAFPAFGAFLGAIYRGLRILPDAEGRSRVSEGVFLLGLLGLGLILWGVGHGLKEPWLWSGTWVQEGGQWRLHGWWGGFTWRELTALHNVTLPSVLERLGWVCMAGAWLGGLERLRPRWLKLTWMEVASRESLLLYMLHLNLIFGVLLSAPVLRWTGLDWNTLGWPGTLAMTLGVLGVTLAAGVTWQRIRETPERMRRLQRLGVAALFLWFLVGGWWTFRYYVESPELAKEPYRFLNAARVRKGLAPTPDGLSRDPSELEREAQRRKARLTPRDLEAVRRR